METVFFLVVASKHLQSHSKVIFKQKIETIKLEQLEYFVGSILRAKNPLNKLLKKKLAKNSIVPFLCVFLFEIQSHILEWFHIHTTKKSFESFYSIMVIDFSCQ